MGVPIGPDRDPAPKEFITATQASPGQGTEQVSPERAPPGQMAVIVIRNRKTGEGPRYSIADQWLP